MSFDFDKEVLESSKELPILVSYSAGYCGSCKYLNMLLDQEYRVQKGSANPDLWKFIKINAQENLDLVEEWDVVNVPHLFIFKNGRVLGENVGAMNKLELQAQL